jgi:hypothetical protein
MKAVGLFAVALLLLNPEPDMLNAQEPPTSEAVTPQSTVEFEGSTWRRVGEPRFIHSDLLRQVGVVDGVLIFVEARLTGPFTMISVIYIPQAEQQFLIYRLVSE